MADDTSARRGWEDGDTSPLGVYEVLERLEHAGPCVATMQIVAELEQLRDQTVALLLRAKEALLDHEHAAMQITEAIVAKHGVDRSVADAIDDAVMELFSELSGSRKLYEAMWSLRDAIDPDSRVTVDANGDIVLPSGAVER